MATANGGLTPPTVQDPTAATLSSKRKRDEDGEAAQNGNGDLTAPGATATASTEKTAINTASSDSAAAAADAAAAASTEAISSANNSAVPMPTEASPPTTNKSTITTINTASTKNGTTAEPVLPARDVSQEALEDLLTVLEKHDTTPSVLEYNISDLAPLQPSATVDATVVHDAKRVKLTQDSAVKSNGHTNTATISARLHAGHYVSLAQVQDDIEKVCAALVEPIKSKERQRNGARLPVEDVKTMQRVLAFQHKATSLLPATKEPPRTKAEKERRPNTTIKGEPGADQKGRTVLTLYGNAPTQRQLFSSLQKPVNSTTADLSLEELGLPNMLNATQVLPLDRSAALGPRPSTPTFAETFAPPAHLPQLNPPRSTKHSASNKTTISWLPPDFGTVPAKPSRKTAYTLQPLTVGSWIDYGSRDAVKDSTALSSTKRRRRESLVMDLPKPLSDMTPEELLAQERALFNAAYSSFTPSQDNSKAIVPRETRDAVWWHKLGQRRFDRRFVLDPALGGHDDDDSSFPVAQDEPEADRPEDADATLGGEDEMKAFEDAIENWDDEAFKPEKLVSRIVEDQDDVDQMLRYISELIETLASHQRIRNSYIASQTARPLTSPAPISTAVMGAATEPSKEETEIYKALRSQLAQAIAKLPPYAVAKLDGEQLEDLAVSKTIITYSKDCRGTMEEDQLTRMIRSTAAMQAAAGPTSVSRASTAAVSNVSTNTTAGYGRTPAPPRSAHAPSLSYYKTPATGYGRTSVAAQQNHSTPTAAVARPAYGQASSFNSIGRAGSYGPSNPNPQYYQQYAQRFGQQTPQSYQNQYGARPANPGAFGQTPAVNGVATPSQYNQQRPATYTTANQPASSLNSFQQRPSTNGHLQGQQQQYPNAASYPGAPATPSTPGSQLPQATHVPQVPQVPQAQQAPQVPRMPPATPASHVPQPQAPNTGYANGVPANTPQQQQPQQPQPQPQQHQPQPQIQVQAQARTIAQASEASGQTSGPVAQQNGTPTVA